jgi:hypothetical protein
MPATKHDAIVKAIVDALLTAPAVAGGNVDDATTWDELPEGVAEGVRVLCVDSEPLSRRYGAVDWRTVVRCSCFSRVDTPGANGRPSGQIAATVYARLMAAQTLGGLAETIDEPRMQWDTASQLSSRAGVLHLDFPVRHTTTGRILT